LVLIPDQHRFSGVVATDAREFGLGGQGGHDAPEGAEHRDDGVKQAHRHLLEFRRFSEQLEKMFALLALIADNSEIYDTTEKALVAVKLVAGYADPMIDPRTGELTQVPQSIAFDAMDQDVFDQFYQAAIDGVLRFILPTMDRDTADHLLEQIVMGWG
jgi:hypothetical protein